MNVEAEAIGRSLRSAVRGRLREAAARLPDPGRPGDSPDPSTELAWSALVRMSAVALEAPLDAGGLGLGLTAATAVAEELGRAGLAARYLAVALAVDAATTGEAPAPLVDNLVAGAMPVSLAGFAGADPPVRAVSGEDGTLRLTGRLPVDPGGAALLVPVVLDGRDVRLVLLPAAEVPVRPGREPTGALALATFAGAPCPDAVVLCHWTLGEGCPEGLPGRARVRQAAYLLGVARGALLTAVRHATDRRQFGRPLREFQSVSFRLAEAYVHVEAVRLAVEQAVRLADAGRPYGRQAAEVLAQAAETAAGVSALTMQLCGARGLTGELPAYRYHLLVRREGNRLGRPGQLWREAGRDRLRACAPVTGDPGPCPVTGPEAGIDRADTGPEGEPVGATRRSRRPAAP